MALRSLFRRSPDRRGFTLVELAIVLAVASLLFAGLWRLMAGGSTQMRDQAAADQMKQLLTAVQQYLVSSQEGRDLLKVLPGGGRFQLDLNGGASNPDFLNYRPAGFTASTTNSYNQSYAVFVRRDDGGAGGTDVTSYSVMILTRNGEVIPDASGARISALIGNDGGFIYSTDVCNAAAGVGGATQNAACGAYGAWAASVLIYAPAGGSLGRLAARATNVASTDVSMWLARKNYPPVEDFNTMQTNMYFPTIANTVYPGDAPNEHNLFLGRNTIFGGPNAASRGGAIRNIEYIEIQRPAAANNTPGLRVTSQSGCSKNNPGDACPYVVIVSGDQSVNGLLYANKLFAEFFIYNPTSDARLKHDIRPLESPLDDLSKIRALSFRMNDGNDKKLGVIAQEVKEVYPELIQDLGQGYEGVDYMGLISPLIGAVQQLKDQNEALKAEVKELSATVKGLQKAKAK